MSRIRKTKNITVRRHKTRGGAKTSEDWAEGANINDSDIERSIRDLSGYDDSKKVLYSPEYNVNNSSYVDVYFKNVKSDVRGEAFKNVVKFIKDFFENKSEMTNDDVMLVYISFNLLLHFLNKLTKKRINQIPYEYLSSLADVVLDKSALTVKLNGYVIFFPVVMKIQSKIVEIIDSKFSDMASLPVVTPPPKEEENKSSEDEEESDSEEEPDVTGLYSSKTNKMDFMISKDLELMKYVPTGENLYLVRLINANNPGIYVTGAITESELNNFEETVINKEQQWTFDNKTLPPGIWKDYKHGGSIIKKKSRTSKKNRKSKKSRKSKKGRR